MLVQNEPAIAFGQGISIPLPNQQLHHCFETLADRQPDEPAILFKNKTLTYAQLDQSSNALANALLKRSLRAEEPIGVLVERSGSLPMAFLAILKAGGVYVPLVNDHPANRLANIVEQTGMRYLIALDGLEPASEILNALAVNNDGIAGIFRPEDAQLGIFTRPNVTVSASSLAAILFTSGTNGQPKGVLLRHDACINMVCGHLVAQNITSKDRLLLSSGPGFILGFRELCLPLLSGAAYVAVTRNDIDNPERLLMTMSQHKVSIALFTPSYLRLFQGKLPSGLRCIMTAGEHPDESNARHYAKSIDYWNMHGATEVCGTICMYKVNPDDAGTLPSGRPFNNTSVYLLDEHGNEVPQGEVGEIYVVGAGLANGYLNQPELSAQIFVQTKFGRAYKTRDMGRWRTDGNLETIGRSDDVIKVSGQSVALSEIERTLLHHPKVKQAAVIQNGNTLVAFIECEDDSAVDWRDYLSSTLPAYMIPSSIDLLERLPTNSSGKIDRQALSDRAKSVSRTSSAPPEGRIEQEIADVWADILKLDSIGRHDNFFAIGGTSLLAIAISQKLQSIGYAVTVPTLLVQLTVAGLADHLSQVSAEAPAPADNISTRGQEDFWIGTQLGVLQSSMLITRLLRISGDSPNQETWRAAWQKLLARHSALRTAFYRDADEKIRWQTYALDELPAESALKIASCNSLEEASEPVALWTSIPFDLSKAPLARAGLIQTPEAQLFWFAFHHAVVDGLSARILQEELYALLQGKTLPPAADGINLACIAEQAYLRTPQAERDRHFWQEHLKNTLADSNGNAFNAFATDFERPLVPTRKAAKSLTERLDAQCVEALTQLARSQGVGMHSLLLALLGDEARRRSDRTTLIIGSAISMRPAGAEQAVGLFVNLLPLVLRGDRSDQFNAHLHNAQSTLNSAIQSIGTPSSQILRDFQNRHPDILPLSRASIFDISLTANTSRISEAKDAAFSLAPQALPGELNPVPSGIDLAFSHEPDLQGGLILTLAWNPELYRQSTAQSWLAAFKERAGWLAADLSRAQSPMPPLLPSERQVLQKWEQGPALPVPEFCFQQVFEDWAQKTPLHPAVVCEHEIITYAELDRRANGIAHALLDHGLKTGDAVAVLTDICDGLAAVVLGIWKAGAVYLPLAADHPPERLAHMMSDAKARILVAPDNQTVPTALSDMATAVLTPDCRQPSERRPEIVRPADSVAYVIYTSGTTGMPKGVPISHAAMINTIQESARAIRLTADDRVALVATPSFDASLWELGLGLLNGAALTPISKSLRDDPWAMKDYYAKMAVTVAFHAPSYLRISKNKPFNGLRVLIVGGEPSSHEDVNIHGHGIEFWHAYGPTETTIIVSLEYIPRFPDPGLPLSVGSPLANTRISIRNGDGQPVPPGVIGEIWLGGLGLSSGYLNNDALTAERFVSVDGGRFYRSGDLGCWTNDGRLVIKGRIDHQIKIHGQRIELEEIEKALLALPDAKEALVLVENAANGTKFLRGFVSMAEGCVLPGEADWHARLAARLPHYMIPATLTAIDSIPLTVNGKVNREALLQLVGDAQVETIKTPPSAPMEALIAPIWSELLGQDVCREDNFFGLGGNSLLAVSMAHRLSKALAVSIPARYLFTAPTLAAFAARIADSQFQHESPDNIIETSDLATEGELEFWLAEQTGLNTNPFIMPLTRKMQGNIPALEKWNRAWAALTERHESLRAQFVEDQQGALHRSVVQLDRPELEEITVADSASANTLIRQRQNKPISLNAAPLWRAGLVHVEQTGETLFWLAMHHAIGDGGSLNVLLGELALLLQGEELPPLVGSYAHSAARAAAYRVSDEFKQDSLYWRNSLAALPETAFEDWPLDMPRLQDGKSGCHRLQICLPTDITLGLKAIAQRYDSSMHALMLTLLGMETRRRSKRRQFLIGTPADMRETTEEAGIIGYYVNMLPLIMDSDANDSFESQLIGTQQALAAALHHGRVPFARIYNDFRQQRPAYRHPSRYPLFDFVVNEVPIAPSGNADFQFLTNLNCSETIHYELSESSTSQDMVLTHEIMADGKLMLQLQANSAIYSLETTTAWLNSLQELADWLAADLSRAQSPIPPLLPSERQVLQKWEQGPALPVPELCFQHVFEDWVQKTPLHPAVVCEHETITYAELDRRANGIAHALLDHGLETGDAVAVLTDICDGLAAVVLGIWKAGAVYLPLAADHPPERLAHMMSDAKARILVAPDNQPVPAALSDMATAVLTPDCRQPSERRPEIVRPASSVAYVIYTSGTTGMPKGVPISHAAMINTIQESARAVSLTADDRVALVATPSFDASLWELGLGLLNGAALAPISKSLRDDPWAMKDYYAKMAVTVAFHAPSYLRISKNKPFNGLRVLIVGGEPSSHEDVNIHGHGVEFWHAYGPTETTIIVSLEYIPRFPDPGLPLSVGSPLANTRISIRNGDGQPVPPGVIGEIWLGGLGLSSGYLNNDALTAERFVSVDGGRFYRSGDLGCWTNDGRLVIKGRIDHQIKIHGQRIELEEIEKALLALPDVTEALVLVDNAANGTKFLRGFVAMAKGCALPGEADWHGCLAVRLPHYMIPATLTAIERIPVTVNGKVDREALLQLVGDSQAETIKTPPSGPMEALIAPIWSELLGQDVCREDNFFGLGGNSLLAVAMAHRLSKVLAISIPARYLYTAPTLTAFAARAAEARLQQQNHTRPPETSDAATEGELEFWVAEQAGINTTPFIMPLIRKVQGDIPELEQWNLAWAALTERHESLRTQFVEDDQGTLRRIVTQAPHPVLEEITVSNLASANTLIRQRQNKPISLNAAPLWRAGLVHIEQTGETLFWLAMHHAIGDGGSLNVLLGELALLLQGKELPPLLGSYAHSAARALAYLSGDEFKHDFSYWSNSLTALPEAAFEDWALDMPRLQSAKPGYHRLQTCLPADITLGLKTIAQRYDSSMHALMLTLLGMETRRRSKRRQFLIGTPADMRETTEEAGIIGYYVNMLPLIMDGDTGDSFESQLIGTQQALAAALHHGRVPFARIYNDFRQQRPGYRHPSRYPLFDFAVNENPQARIAKADPGFRTLARFNEAIEYESVDVSPGQDMVFIHEILPGGELMLQLQVNSAVYLLETATAWFNSLRWWVEWLCADKSHAQMPLPKLLPQESERLAQNGYGRVAPRPNQRFHELFEAVVDSMGADSSKRLAVMTPENQSSYLSVEEQANCLANALIQSGIKPGAVIGVLTGRSPQLPSTILGIWKAGAIYLPLSADLPVERLCHMVNDAAVRQLIVLDGLDVPQAIAQLTGAQLRPEQLETVHNHRPAVSGDAGDTAYIIYTSGSTGLPKGTLIAHQSYVNMALGCGEILGMNSDDRCLMFYSPSFDVSLSDMGVPLLFGATVCPVHDDLIDSPNQFMKFLNDAKITVADVSPTYLRLFDSADFQYLRILVTGGEAPFPDDIVKYSKQISYFNAYGPTENTVTCALGRLSINHARKPSCGLPLPNTSIHICDANGNLLPPGEIGELWLGGMGLAKGYLGRADLTSASFVETPEGRRYRSGDIGRWLTRLPDTPAAVDEVQFLGRMDSQIKMNGIRIELGEIEHIVNGHPSVFQATVLADEIADKKQRLSAFIHLRNDRACPSDIEWRDYLSGHLPAATIPTSFIIVDSIPVNSSGKVDVASLRGLARAQQNHAVSDNPPQTPMEKRVAAIWCELLRLETIRKDDNFFALGGHSLVAIAAAHRLERDLNRPVAARELFAFPILSDFSRRIDVEDLAPAADFAPTDKATTGQLEFWVAEKIGKANRGLNLTFSVAEQDRKVAAEQWQQAWGELVARHPALRTYFKEDADGQLLRQILPALDIELERQCLPDLSAARIHIANLQAMIIPMSSAPLWRAGLVFVEDTRQEVFWLALHHAVGDGISTGILLDELSLLLAGDKLPALPGDYNHFAGRELAYLKDRASAADAEYWSETLDGLGNGDENTPQPFDEWPLDFGRPINSGDGKNKGGHFFRIALDAATAKNLKAFASQHGASLHALMMALLAMETSRRTERPNFVMGTVGSTRELAEDAATVNYFLNMLPIPCRINPNDSVEQSMAAMQLGISRALQHERYPFAQICQDFRNRHAASNHPTRFPLFDLAVTENPGLGSASERHIKLVPINDSATSEMRYDLRPNPPPQDMVLIHEALADEGLGLYWYVDASLYEKDTALAWINTLLDWMRFIVSPERHAQTALPLLSAAEEKLLDNWQYGPSLPKPAGYLQDQFMRVAGQDPHMPALLLDQESQSYDQIDKQSNSLAQVLRRRGIGPGVAVGVLTERSTALPETVLAIWKAGGCYLPLSVELPGERLKFIAEDADINLLVALDGLAIPSELASYPFLRPETLAFESTAPINHGCRDTDPAYIIYTSGSTGEPKGVVITFEGYANFCLGMKLALTLFPDDKILQISSPTFDAWLHELGLAWFHGGALAPVVRRELDDISGMRLKMQGLGITIATLSPSYLGLFGNAEFPGLRMLMTMGEPPVKANALHYASRLTYINGYGPSENSVGSCIGQITPQSTRMTAGRPLANTSAHILNKDRQPVPPGSAGILWLGGRGLSPGYLNRPELTAERFVETPEGRFYNSGDLARWTQQGEIEILGRIDNQVKLRGQRIELEEIEHQISLHPDALQAAVVIHSIADGTPGLYGFVCLRPEASPIDNREWRSFLAKKVPDYMIPSAIKAVSGIPVSLAGKVDRKRLIADYLDQDIDMIASNDSDVGRLTPPGNRVEKLIAEAWSEIFPGRTIHCEDNFFELGGHSLAAISVVNRLRLEFTCTINNLYEHPVLADFAKTCQPRHEHIRDLLVKVKLDWQSYAAQLEANPNERIDGLNAAQEHYCARNKKYSDIDLEPRNGYENILLTGATGYVGCYVLREMLKEGKRKITALIRGADHAAGRDRLHQVLAHYFGPEAGAELAYHPGLQVLSSDLGQPNLGLDKEQWTSLAAQTQAIFHCAANVRHYGHYQEFHRDNVSSVQNLLELAAYNLDAPADFHLVSTTSVVGKPPESGFKLFTEYDLPNPDLSDNYYIRTKQEAERLVLAARDKLNNAGIYRVGNVVFATDDSNLQINLKDNAFFRLVAALIELGAVPKKVEALFCHVDLVAKAVLLLAETRALSNETHHIEHSQETSLAEFISSAFPLATCDFGLFIEHLIKALDKPEQQQAFYEVLDGFNLYGGQAPQVKAQHIELTSDRTNQLLKRLGLEWTDVSSEGQLRFLREANLHFKN